MATVSLEAPAVAAPLDTLYEVIDGQYVEKAPMGAFEYELAFFLGRIIGNFVDDAKIGRALVEMVFDFTPILDRQRRPDVAFVSAAKWPMNRRVPKTAAWAMVPDLAVEIASPSNTVAEVIDKVVEYFRVGVGLVWVIYPSQEQVYVYHSPTTIEVLDRSRDLTGGDALPGFRLSVADLFGEPEPEA